MTSNRIYCRRRRCRPFVSYVALSVFLMLLLPSNLPVHGEFYSSIDSLKRLDSIESSLLLSFRKYSEGLEDYISIIRRFMERIKFQHEKAEQDVEDYLGNPINAFKLIERVVRDWKDVADLLRFNDVSEELMDSLTQLRKKSPLPDENELRGAILGLARLQDIYDIDPEDMANGKGYGQPLNWRECLEIATTLMDESRMDLAVNWLQQAERKLQNSNDSAEIKDYFATQINEHLARVHHSMGDKEKAQQHLNAISKSVDTKLTMKMLNRLTYDKEKYTPFKESDRHQNYARLCQGKSKNITKLSCYLDSKIHPYFVLNPLQIEPLLMEPYIRLYHNLLNDEQVTKLFDHAKQRFFRSEVIKAPGENEVTEKRVSQQTWVAPRETPTSTYMYRLVGLITGFNMTNVEQMQVANYGIGGLYVPHYDYMNNTELVAGLYGDRITTSMFYLSDVTQGGYTIFPELDVYLKPVKGAM
ncbi:prolyl 4-hydroxylase subunit alpha-1-like, partial [Musca vetustissima]|uniref:prolyl 4-hydroxylase subunit alpha-1-like n=1 Tax=Musca vetustissima TaxID=27455 RepID=UPI002AB7A73E